MLTYFGPTRSRGAAWLGRGAWLRAAPVALAFWLSSGSVWGAPNDAEDPARTSARALAQSGVGAYQAGDYATAESRFSRAFAMWQAPSLAFWSARALEKMGKWVEAEARYREAEAAPVDRGDQEVQRTAQRDAAQARKDLLARIPRVSIRIEGARPSQVEVQLDGTSVKGAALAESIPVNPGRHTLVAQSGAQTQREQLEIAAGERRAVTLSFVDAESPGHISGRDFLTAPPRDSDDTTAGDDSATWRTVGWVGIGVGGAGLVASGLSAIMASNKRDALKDDCPRDECPLDLAPAEREQKEAYDSLRTFSTVTWITGALVATGGLVLLVTHYDDGAEMSFGAGPGSLHLHGRF